MGVYVGDLQINFRGISQKAELQYLEKRRISVGWFFACQHIFGVRPDMRTFVLLLGIVFCGCGLAESAENPPKVIAEGKWSKAVIDSQGYGLRGRLVLCENSVQGNLREVVVYVELQDASHFVASSMQLYCDLGKHDFRPENKSGLQCELHDGMNNPVPPAPLAFGGRIPQSLWVTLPTDGTIRLRASPFGIARANAKAICPHLGSFWVIADEDPNDYYLSGTFFIAPREDNPPRGDGHVWKGAIELPAVRIANPKH